MAKKILDSWKEIAQYLKRDVRTCQRWEKELGLPIHRFEDSPRSRVFAYQDELDRWLKEKSQTGDISSAKKKSLIKTLTWALGIVILIIVVWWAISLFLPKEPHDFKLDHNRLIVFDKNNHPIWEYEFQKVNLSPNETYQNRFQKKNLIFYPGYGSKWELPLVYIGDINNDHHHEVLFMINWANKGQPENYLYCFDYQGRILWKFMPQEAPVFGQITYSKFFNTHGFHLEDFNHDGRYEILAVFACDTFFPTLLVLLDCQGRRLGHYWNAGQINNLITCDLEEDGQKEIILGVQNNEWRQCGLVVLSPDHVEGASPQENDYYNCKNTDLRGREKYYLLLPKNDVAAKIMPINQIHHLQILDGPRIQVQEQVASIIYTFDRNMNLVFFDHSFSFNEAFNELKRKGSFPSEMTAEVIANRIKEKGIRYFDGEKWVTTPTMTRFWKEK